MKRTPAARMSVTKRAYVRTLSVLLIAWLALSVLTGCDSPASSPAATGSPPSEPPRLVHQADGRELMVIANPQAREGTIGIVKRGAASERSGSDGPGDRSTTVSSRPSSRGSPGGLRNCGPSQWDTVRRGEQVMSLYSPDFMTAEAEYLEATSGASQTAAQHADRRIWHVGRRL